MHSLKKALRDPKLFTVMMMGFFSGLPLLLVGSTLKGWLAQKHIALATIGFFSWTAFPYTWKFIWAPMMDRFVLPYGRRRGWLLVSQLGLIVGLVLMSTVDPAKNLSLLAFFCFFTAFFAASQDIVIDAYRREVLPDEELGLGSSLAVFGYRIAMLVTGGLAFYLADHMAWGSVYQIMAGLMVVGMIITLMSPEPKVTDAPPRTLRESVIGPLKEFFTRDSAWLILAFIALYKVGESMASDLLTPLYVSLGFTNTEIGQVAKVVGIWAAISGGLAGGVLIVRLGIYRCLWIFGVLQALGLLLFSALSLIGHDKIWLGISIGGENFTSGMATSAYVAFMASQINKRFTATQYALLSSFMGMPRVFLGGFSGLIAEQTGFTLYFVCCMLFTIPGLLLLFRVKPLLRDI